MEKTTNEGADAAPRPGPTTAADELKEAARNEAHVPLWKDFAYFLRHNKKWWLLPILIVLLVLIFFVALSSTAVAPFIYSVF